MRRCLRTVFAVLALAIVCAACNVDVHVDVLMKADGTGTITVTATADAEVVKQTTDLAKNMRLDDLRGAGWSVQGPAPTPSGGLQIIFVHPFQTPTQATAILADLNGPSGPLKSITLGRTKKGDTTTFTLGGTLQVDGGLDAFSDAQLFAALGATPYAAQAAAANTTPAQAVTITFQAKLPGTVETSTAKAGSASSPKGLAWVVPVDGTIVDVSTTATQHTSKNVWASPLARGAKILFAVWIGASAIFIGFVIIARRRRRQMHALR